jgi:hypothetical protein
VNPEIWATLDIAPVRDRDAIRRAYARRLKVTNPEDDAEAFRDLRAAYEEALAALDWDWAWEDEPSEEEGDAVEAETLADDVVTTISMEQFRLMMGGAPSGPPVFAAPPPLEGDDDHARLLDALERLVLGDPPAETAAVEAALAAVLASPALEQVAVAGQTEQRIAYLITQHAPRSDALVRPAINAFRWAREGVRARYDGLVEAVLDRDADIVFRSGLLRDEGPRRTAFLALSRPLNQGPAWHDRAWPGFDAKVRDLLHEIDARRPSLHADLDADSVAHWRARLARPRWSPSLLGLAVLAPLPVALVSQLTAPDLTLALRIQLVGTVGLLTAMAAWLFGLAPLRRHWREDWEWRAPTWTRVAWSPASLALLAIAGGLPDNGWMTAAVGIVAVLLVLWAIVTGDIQFNRSAGAWSPAAQLAVAHGPLIVWLAALSLYYPEARTPTLWAAFAGAAACSVAGTTTLPIAWFHSLPRAARVGLTLALIVAAIQVGVLALGVKDAPGSATLVLAGVAAVVMAHRPAADGLGSGGMQWRYRAMFFSVTALFHLAGALGWLAASSLWFLFGVVVSLVAALFVEKEL